MRWAWRGWLILAVALIVHFTKLLLVQQHVAHFTKISDAGRATLILLEALLYIVGFTMLIVDWRRSRLKV